MTNLSPSQMEQVMNGKVAGKLWPKKLLVWSARRAFCLWVQVEDGNFGVANFYLASSMQSPFNTR